ncbi:MAG: isoprenylcysteine carboxylmethyltransferase family protein [Gracilimonas sp.]
MLKLKIPPVVVFLICCALMWAIHKLFPNSGLKLEFRMEILVSLIAVGGFFGIVSLYQFARKSTTVNPHKPQNTNRFVKSGVYKISRNPMYLALVLVLGAAVFYWGNPFTIVVLPLFVWYMNEFQIKPEEEVMEQKFGDKFVEYRKEVRRWL